MYWFMKPEFKCAYDAASQVLEKINCKFDSLVDTTTIMDAVESLTGYDIKFLTVDFSELSKKSGIDALIQCGAALYAEESKKTALVMVNSQESIKMQRFSLVHELGHLMLNNMYIADGFEFSAHIDMDITSIPDELWQNNETFKNEQLANVFALLVLIPDTSLLNALSKYDSLDDIAHVFGLEKDALVSRIQLGVGQ